MAPTLLRRPSALAATLLGSAYLLGFVSSWFTKSSWFAPHLATKDYAALGLATSVLLILSYWIYRGKRWAKSSLLLLYLVVVPVLLYQDGIGQLGTSTLAIAERILRLLLQAIALVLLGRSLVRNSPT
ncbi:MAG: hypothetical protein EOO63_16730 [Hymenobacter sp.]|nr:MAG: hypothetical protein EOO63_16730 [Hymenobacter sp.]